MDQYLGTLEAIGIDLLEARYQVRRGQLGIADAGAWGVGWQVMLEVWRSRSSPISTVRRIDLELVPAELTYGLERLIAFLQVRDSVYDIAWTPT